MAENRVVLIAVDPSEQAKQAFDYYAEALHRPENKVRSMFALNLSLCVDSRSRSGPKYINYNFH